MIWLIISGAFIIGLIFGAFWMIWIQERHYNGREIGNVRFKFQRRL